MLIAAPAATEEIMKIMKPRILGLAAALILASSPGMADDLKVLSAGAMQRGLVTVAAKFKEYSGNQVQIRYATAPELRKILTESGAAADVILAPNPTLAELASAGKVVSGSQKEIGGVGSAVLGPLGSPLPRLLGPGAFQRPPHEADPLRSHPASRGTHIERML